MFNVGRILTLFLTGTQTSSDYNRHASIVETRAFGASLSPQRGEGLRVRGGHIPQPAPFARRLQNYHPSPWPSPH